MTRVSRASIGDRPSVAGEQVFARGLQPPTPPAARQSSATSSFFPDSLPCRICSNGQSGDASASYGPFRLRGNFTTRLAANRRSVATTASAAARFIWCVAALTPTASGSSPNILAAASASTGASSRSTTASAEPARTACGTWLRLFPHHPIFPGGRWQPADV